MYLCQVCGNDISPTLRKCPYCCNIQDKEEQQEFVKKSFLQKTVNLEKGRPTVESALQHLHREISSAKLEQIRVLTLIHGYGSTGKGGAIGRECRKTLDYLLQQGEIVSFVCGEEFHRKHGKTKDLLNRFPILGNHSYLGQQNRGITVVVVF